MNTHKGYTALSVLLLSLYHLSFAQDLETFGKGPWVKASGGVSWTTQFTNTNDDQNQRDPLFWLLQGNINFNLLGIIDAPFSFSFNNQESTASQPALPTQFGLSPNYKIYTAHLGWRSMNLSKYTLGGQTFLGVGAEVKPKDHWLSAAAMYGRLQQPIQPIIGQDPGVYRRMGYAVKLTAGKKDFVSLVAFRAKDDESSITLDSNADDVAPQENLVWSLLWKKQFGKKIRFEGEFAQSASTLDTRNTETTLNNFSYFNNVGDVFTPNATTQFKTAYELKLSYNPKIAKFQFGYKRVAPDYQTLGTQSINNDIEEYKLGVSWQMFQKKVTIATNGGIQQNNLDNSLNVGVMKAVGSININWMATQKLTFSASYSTFNSQALGRRSFLLVPVNLQVDSLDFFQVSKNASLTTNYRFGTTDKSQSLTLTANTQDATDSEGNDNNSLNGNLAYTITFAPIKLSISASYNYNNTIIRTVVRTCLLYTSDAADE